MHDEPLDERIREALEPSPEAVERVVRGALRAALATPAPPAPKPRRMGWTVPALAALGLVCLVLLIGRPERVPPQPAPPRAVVTIANVGDVVVATSADRGWLVGNETEPSPPQSIIILSYGGRKK